MTEERSAAGVELERSISLLEATLESTADGILVVDRSGTIVRYNRRFVEIWGVPEEILESGDDDRALAFVLDQLVDPEGFLARVETLYANPERESHDVLEFEEGRVIERYSRPQRIGDEIVGRVWSFREVTDRKRTEEALRQSEARYRRLFEESRHAIYITRENGDFLDVNRAAEDLFGYPRDELLTMNARDFYVDPHDRRRFKEAIAGRGSVRDYGVRLRGSGGEEMECLLTSTARIDGSGEVVGYEGIVEDVTERKRAREALRASEIYYRSLIENALETITIVDGEGRILYESPSVERVLGYEPEELGGREIFEFVHPDDRSTVTAEFQKLLAEPGEITRIELRFRHRNGAWRILEAIARNLLHDPVVEGLVINARDVTERKEAEEQLLHDAFHDRLTGLPNRTLFMDRLSQLVKRVTRRPEQGFSVLFLDLDRFKVVNDSLGHAIGDQLLISLGRRLEACVRPGDTVARLGGDEFTILLDGTRDLAEAIGVVDRIHESLERPFRLDGHEVFATASVGIASSATPYDHGEEILRDADLAMYRAKARGGGDHEVFDRSMHARAMEQLRLETDLRRALDRDEMRLHYQPIVELETGVLVGLEALLRWEHPERGLLAPDTFLERAEETHLIVPIGWWALGEASRRLREWRERFGPRAPGISVNLSGLQLAQADVVERIRGVTGVSKLPAGALQLELTESIIMDDAESSIGKLRELKELGVRFSIDDFGTGYSSLSYLHRFPTDEVKIDRSFVAPLAADGDQPGIVRTIVDLAHDLGMKVVAEGVETEDQLRHVRGLGCELGQGFLFSRGMPPEEVEERIASGAAYPV